MLTAVWAGVLEDHDGNVEIADRDSQCAVVPVRSSTDEGETPVSRLFRAERGIRIHLERHVLEAPPVETIRVSHGFDGPAVAKEQVNLLQQRSNHPHTQAFASRPRR